MKKLNIGYNDLNMQTRSDRSKMTSINNLIMLCILMDMNVDTDKPKVSKRVTVNSKHNKKQSFKHSPSKHATTHKTYKSRK
jgi:hypothetical protein